MRYRSTVNKLSNDSGDGDRRAKGGKENKINMGERVSQRPVKYVTSFGGIRWLVLVVVVVGLFDFGVSTETRLGSCNGSFVYRYAALSFAARVVVCLPRRRRTRTPEYIGRQLWRINAA